MTRFARGSGSKGSNEKTPEEGTSWQEMREAMLSKKQKVPDVKVDEPAADVDIPTVDEIQSVWADLVGESKKKSKKQNEGCKKSKTKNYGELPEAVTSQENTSIIKSKKLSKKRKAENNFQEDSDSTPRVKKMKKEKKVDCAMQVEPESTTKSKKVKGEKKKKIASHEDLNPTTGSKKKAKKKPLDATPAVDNGLVPKCSPLKKKKLKNIAREEEKSKKADSASMVESPAVEKKPQNHNQNEELSETVNSSKKVQTPREKKRRKEALKASEVIINGQIVKVAPFDGFIVQADDASRLQELRKSMKSKGIPEVEREKAIKLERRRAEKALARLKKRVCFHCRGSGHNLSECPQVQEDQRAAGICYKCGSTEHTYFQCKVTRKDDFRFAECFICKEQGHIAKQCPDNPRGLYPRGGACITCGDVTHLKKDCPKYLAEKEDEKVTVGTSNDYGLEALEEDAPVKKFERTIGKKSNKHIKF